jgi:hypothetical protein
MRMGVPQGGWGIAPKVPRPQRRGDPRGRPIWADTRPAPTMGRVREKVRPFLPMGVPPAHGVLRATNGSAAIPPHLQCEIASVATLSTQKLAKFLPPAGPPPLDGVLAMTA